MDNIAQEPLEPSFDSILTAGEREEIQKAHRWAYKAILGVVEGFKSAPPNSSHWQNYFACMDRTATERIGPDWWQRKATVEEVFRKMAVMMCKKSVRYHKQRGCTDDMLGNTGFGQGGPINLCDDFFNDDWLRFSYFTRADWVRALAVVHEMSHAVVGGTKDIDKSYSVHACYLLSSGDPAKAVQNAQNYAYFAMRGHPLAPGPEQLDTGIWVQKRVGGTGPICAKGPAAAMIAEDILMLAYPEPEPPKQNVEASDVGGLLYYKILDLHDGKETWSDATLMKGSREIRSGTAPALAVVDHKVYCAYIDPYFSRLMFVSAGTSRTSSEGSGLSRYFPTGWSELQWSAPLEIVGNVNEKFGPALAAFSGGQSSGLYSVYVEKRTGLLKCAVLFWGEGFFKLTKLPSGFTPVDFDRPRKSSSAPALVVFNGQLKCVYLDEKLGYVTLNYQAATGRPGVKDVKPGTWHEELDSDLRLETETIALAQWNISSGPALVALGRGKGDDRTLHYACAPPTGQPNEVQWQAPVQTRACRTSFASALLSYGPVLHSFHQHDDGWIDWLTATSPHA